MKILPIVVLRALPGALAAAATLAAQAQLPAPYYAPPQNVINLHASATVEVAKDQMSIVFSTTREGFDAAEVQGQLKQALDAALAEARKAARPGQVDVRTGNFSLQPRWSPKGGSNGWTGSAELVVEGRDMPALSQLAGRIQTLTIARTAFGLSREAREKVEAEVTAMAIDRFKARAELVAREFGFASYSLREVQVQGSEVAGPIQPVLRAQVARAAAADESLPVEAGKAAVTATVSGSVQLSPR